MIRIIISFFLLLSHGYAIKYDHVPTADAGYYEVYDPQGKCIAGDVQLSDFPAILEEIER